MTLYARYLRVLIGLSLRLLRLIVDLSISTRYSGCSSALGISISELSALESSSSELLLMLPIGSSRLYIYTTIISPISSSTCSFCSSLSRESCY